MMHGIFPEFKIEEKAYEFCCAGKLDKANIGGEGEHASPNLAASINSFHVFSAGLPLG